MTDTLASVHDILRRLDALGSGPGPAPRLPVEAVNSAPPHVGPREPVDLIISPNEISMAHGTGVLLTRLLDDAGPFVTLRAFNHWGGKQAVRPVVDIVLPTLPEGAPPREAIADFVVRAIQPYEIRRIVTVAYFREDVLASLVIKAATGAPLTLYVMDDHTLYHETIPRAEMAELCAVADARFAISPEMRTAYQDAFRCKFHVLPPIVADKFVRQKPSPPYRGPADPIEAVMIGNIWHQNWLDRFWGAIRGAPLRVTWFASSEDHHWLKLPPDARDSDQLVIRNGASSADLIEAVEASAFAIVPSGGFDESGHQFAIARLSLPSRMPFIVAAAGTPILVLGEPGSGAARFVRRFGVGETVAYDSLQVTRAARELAATPRQREIRQQAFSVSQLFRASGSYRLLTRTAERRGDISEDRFESAFAIEPGEFGYYVPESVGTDVIPDQVEMVRAFRRLKALGYAPDAVIDVGASSGIWSYTLSAVYPDARYVLVDPLFSRYPHKNVRDSFEVIECAIAEKSGKLKLQVSNDLYNSSLLAVGNVAVKTEDFEVEVMTVDDVVAKKQVEGRIVLKLDVQFAEHLALQGATRALASQIDVVMLELTLDRTVPSAKIFREMIDLMAGYGFEYFDETGEWRNPATGRLEQKDVLFVRAGLFPAPAAAPDGAAQGA